MKKLILSILFMFVLSSIGLTQVAINQTGAEADPSAVLDLSSTTKGFLVPRVTTTQRMAIGTTQSGLMVYDTDTETFWFWNNSLADWTEIKTGSALNINSLADGGSDNTSVFLGDSAGINDDGNNYNTAMGDEAIENNTSGKYNTAVGYKTLSNSNGESNTAFGQNILRYNTSGDYNTAIGREAILYNRIGNNNTSVGFGAGTGSIDSSFSGCVFLGYEAGKNNSNNNKLFIDNSSTSTPLIGGDFSTDQLYFNATKVGIGTTNPEELLDVTSASGNRARMIVSDGQGSNRRVLLFVSPNASFNYARIDAYDYGGGTGMTLRINTVGDGNIISGGNFIPETHISKDLGANGTAWNNVYAHNYVTQGSAAFTGFSVTSQLINHPPMAKKEGTFDEFTEKGLKELDPASLPETLTEGNALLIDEMTTYNYKANYEQQQQLELLKKENAELKARLERLEKLIINK
jgi:hypothetical protein